MTQLVWFRSDLRVHDHAALSHACQRGESVIALACICSQQSLEAGESSAKQSLWRRGLSVLRSSLEKFNIPLKIIVHDESASLPDQILSLCEALEVSHIHFHHRYEWRERKLAHAVKKTALARNVLAIGYHDQVIHPPGSLTTGKGGYYSMFTPFKRAWYRELTPDAWQTWPAPTPQSKTNITADRIPDPWFPAKGCHDDLWPAGEDVAQQRLAGFLEDSLEYYGSERDFPALDGTSQLSPYLNVGLISVRQCLDVIAFHQGGHIPDAKTGAGSWVNELIWREFYRHVWVGFPHVTQGQPFKQHYDGLLWRNAPEEFQRWCDGRTGYPLVDAAMRQLNSTGWMHNRLRMVTAMFLCKHLLIDWRWGERYFMSHLVDGDEAANNGGWQWCASTGTDAAPYFRIFNPIAQSQRFDPKGEFIRRWLPPLQDLDDKRIHEPWKHAVDDYPAPIVDHKAARLRALDFYKA
ncbi:MAG: deoxyribodipyrimidine photo-lyase [Gammaproteobacteria bacterium]|nr:deoxyribodipyrimidine photo-lyase [Gammaproteobacteria bacterium]